MEFFTTTVAGTALVGGLEWRTLTGLASVVKEVGETARDIGSTMYVETHNSAETTCGFLPDERRVELPKKAHSLGALLAGMPDIAPDCVLVIVEDDDAVIVALRDGMPAPGFDGFGTVDSVIEAAQRFIQLSPNGALVYGNYASLQPIALSLEDIVAQSSALKSSRLRAVPRPWIKVVAGAVCIILAVGGGKFLYDAHALKTKLAAERSAYVNVDAEYVKNLSLLFRAAVASKTSMTAILSFLNDTEMQIGGWNLSEIACQKDGCTFVWKNATGTNRTFVPPAKAMNLLYANKGDAITYQLAYTKPLVVGIDATKLPTAEQILRDVSGDLQEYKDMGIEQVFDSPVPNYGVPAGLPSAPANTLKEGAYSVKGPLFAVDALAKLPDATTLDSVRFAFDADGTITFNILGKYYVK